MNLWKLIKDKGTELICTYNILILYLNYNIRENISHVIVLSYCTHTNTY